VRVYDPERIKLSSWLGHLACNLARDWARSNHARVARLMKSDDEPILDAPNGDFPVERAARLEAARRAFRQLQPREQAFLRAIVDEESTPAELARRMGVTTNTVYSRKFKLAARLRRMVEAEEMDE
jgi:RNA polymerase sigma factor (sigma-70 family)